MYSSRLVWNQRAIPLTRSMWPKLPQELKDWVFRALLDGEDTGIAPLATVSREWQTVIERHNFARIKLTPARLGEFNCYFPLRCRHLVRYIWLCIELNEADNLPLYFHHPQNFHLSQDHTTGCEPIAETIQTLLSILSNWEETGDGLQLDISYHSLKDKKNFEYLTFEPDLPSFSDNLDDPRHGRIAPGLQSYPTLAAIQRTFRDGFGLSWMKQLPSVPVVTALLLRQQNLRCWSPQGLGKFLSLFPRLEEVHYEPWRWTPDHQASADNGYLCMLAARFMRRIRRLAVFENFSENIESMYLVPSIPPRPARARIVGSEFARTSLKLDQLSASFIIEAEHFLTACKPSWTWPNLTTLSLTSQLLAPDVDPAKVNQLLTSAAEVATRMPKLERLEIWNGRRGLAMLFKYQILSDGRAVITRRGTWDLTLEPSVIQAWKEVALERGRRQCVISEELLPDPSIIKGHGDAIYHLGLSSEVIRPISLHQIRKEHRSWPESG
ncbi:hypothetical protein QBC37DRAFT_10764 [Rhypophila decipiens]|uniref:DUF6546 domain-containing protein n=1 Tax=Rhypophila decipiens TaxID=261697 RepID=A0AAN6Y3Q5_9PEZI|nr:hypothetical protein QBC37DRAFT_10764 [Rhypophila decipiens]